MRVLGVDVGLRVCGYVICEVQGGNVKLIKEDQIKLSSGQSLSDKLGFIFDVLKQEILTYRLDAIVVEKLYSHYRHPTTLGLLAQVRGVVLLLAQHQRIKLFEYSPTRVRKSFLGRGNVNASQVKRMAENITGRTFKSLHTADAFSLVFAFANIVRPGKIVVSA